VPLIPVVERVGLPHRPLRLHLEHLPGTGSVEPGDRVLGSCFSKTPRVVSPGSAFAGCRWQGRGGIEARALPRSLTTGAQARGGSVMLSFQPGIPAKLVAVVGAPWGSGKTHPRPAGPGPPWLEAARHGGAVHRWLFDVTEPWRSMTSGRLVPWCPRRAILFNRLPGRQPALRLIQTPGPGAGMESVGAGKRRWKGDIRGLPGRLIQDSVGERGFTPQRRPAATGRPRPRPDGGRPAWCSTMPWRAVGQTNTGRRDSELDREQKRDRTIP